MSKYSYEFKKKIVKDYLSGKGGYRFLAQQYGIPDKKQIQKWVDSYKTFGDEGLKRSREKKLFNFFVLFELIIARHILDTIGSKKCF